MNQSQSSSQAIFSLLSQISGRLNLIDQRLDGINQRLDANDASLQFANERLDAIQSSQEFTSKRLDAASAKIEFNTQRLDATNNRLDVTNSTVASINAQLASVAQRLEQHIQESNDIHQLILASINNFATNTEVRLQTLEQTTEEIKQNSTATRSVMVTKDYLDDKLADLRGEFILAKRSGYAVA
ncbi:MAG: hypothetical protein HYV33_02000 [Candidatus Kerfeldbacteria bacterium]|nr:hypothetical protein [Candidatus Kerfeldbacteria bacterium]